MILICSKISNKITSIEDKYQLATKINLGAPICIPSPRDLTFQPLTLILSTSRRLERKRDRAANIDETARRVDRS